MQPTWFNSDEAFRTNINWYAYELAISIEYEYMTNPKLDWYRKQHNQLDVARFAEYFAKMIGRMVYKFGNSVAIEEGFVRQYYLENNEEQNLQLMEVARDTWLTHIAFCNDVCPMECHGFYDKKTRLFPDLRFVKMTKPTGTVKELDTKGKGKRIVINDKVFDQMEYTKKELWEQLLEKAEIYGYDRDKYRLWLMQKAIERHYEPTDLMPFSGNVPDWVKKDNKSGRRK
ncbi:hypothetical protein AGMMS49992_31350 [Clostridia bacterium]|nr:hypothetical protein AGMMS49992_31350 [Clostridia bacterium]